MTEDEAQSKTCPQTFGVVEQKTSEGVFIRYAGPWPCIGSRCMAWRWTSTQVKTFDGEIADPGNGFCGLAGKP